MTAPLLAVRDVGKSYPGGVRALRGLSFTLAAGEVLSLLGPSGCGKTTALRIVAGLEAADTGEVTWSEPLVSGSVGMVFQSPTLMPWTTVERNVWLPLRLRGQSLAAARTTIRDTLDLVGLGGVAGAYPARLSGGMAMRIAIARALVTRPRLLLMDEPFAALDEITRHRLNDELLSLAEATGASILFVTHSLFESVYLSHRVAVMTPAPGRIAETIRIESTRRDPAFRTSAAYAAEVRRVSEALRRANAVPA